MTVAETASTFCQAGFDCLDPRIQVIIVTSLFLLTPGGDWEEANSPEAVGRG
jgi:hypothetical protein